MRHDNPIPSAHPTHRHNLQAAAWGGGLGASYLAMEERHLSAQAQSEQERLLRTDVPVTTPDMPSKFRSMLVRILPQFRPRRRQTT